MGEKRANFYWALMGNIGYLLMQWLLLTYLAKASGAVSVGVYSFALSITAPFAMFLALRMRFVQSTDVDKEHSFSSYLSVRHLTVGFGLLLLIPGVIFLPASHEVRWAILWLGLAKLVDLYTDNYHGHFQLHERMDLIAISRIFNGGLTLLLVMMGWQATSSLSVALSLSTVASVATLILTMIMSQLKCAPERGSAGHSLDWGQIRLILAVGLPLGFANAIVATEAFIPRFFIQSSLGDSQLGVYSALGYTTLMATTFVDALGNSIAPRLSRLARDHGLAAVDKACTRYSALVVLATGVGGLLVFFWGDAVVGIVYSEQFVGYKALLVWLVVVGGLQSLVAIQQWFATIAKVARPQAWIQTSTFLITVMGSFYAAQTENLTLFGVIAAIKACLVLGLFLLVRKRALRKAKVTFRT